MNGLRSEWAKGLNLCFFLLSENATLIDLQRRLGEAKATPKTSGMAHWLVLPNRTPSDTAVPTVGNKH